MESSIIQSAQSSYPVLIMFAEMQRMGMMMNDELDLAWDEAIEMYRIYEMSYYNNPNFNEYDCISDFLHAVKQNEQ